VIKPFLAGKDVKRYQKPVGGKYLILFEKGVTNRKREKMAPEEWMQATYPAVFRHLQAFAEKASSRSDKGDYWWELRACDYYGEFEKPKIYYQVFQVKPCFSYDKDGYFCNNAIWIIPDASLNLCAYLNSRIGWMLISTHCTSIQNGYQLIQQYFGQIPVPIDLENNKEIESLVTQIMEIRSVDPAADTADLEREIDRHICAMFELTEEERGIIEMG
jgi:hypothetical protein